MKLENELMNTAKFWWGNLGNKDKDSLCRDYMLNINYPQITDEQIMDIYYQEHAVGSVRKSTEVKEGEGYTKGEWRIDLHDEGSRYFGNITSELGKGSNGIMNIRTIAILLNYAGREEMQCNAELIASAPRLKEENEKLKKLVDDNVRERNRLREVVKKQFVDADELEKQNEVLLDALKSVWSDCLNGNINNNPTTDTRGKVKEAIAQCTK